MTQLGSNSRVQHTCNCHLDLVSTSSTHHLPPSHAHPERDHHQTAYHAPVARDQRTAQILQRFPRSSFVSCVGGVLQRSFGEVNKWRNLFAFKRRVGTRSKVVKKWSITKRFAGICACISWKKARRDFQMRTIPARFFRGLLSAERVSLAGKLI